MTTVSRHQRRMKTRNLRAGDDVVLSSAMRTPSSPQRMKMASDDRAPGAIFEARRGRGPRGRRAAAGILPRGDRYF
jgi:hypothetical protein